MYIIQTKNWSVQLANFLRRTCLAQYKVKVAFKHFIYYKDFVAFFKSYFMEMTDEENLNVNIIIKMQIYG